AEASVRVLVFLLGLVVLCTSQCDNPPTGCVDEDGTEYEVGSEWERDCMDCPCADQGLSCCKNSNIPEDCELDKEDCTAKAVLQSDKTQECCPL
uniref:VWFC domain-containing protein n=1 Tax=Neogobius melanostomus TaxID=47308 RepID=A0A8C6U0C9_9GOBI